MYDDNNKKSNIKAIMFDLDDTIFDSKKAQYNAICEFKNSFQEFEKMEDSEFAKLWNEITSQCYEKYHAGLIPFDVLKKERIKALFAKFNIQITDEEAKQEFDNYLKIYQKNWLLFDDTINVLDTLKEKYKLAIITNGDSIQQRKKIENTDIKKYFSDIIISDEVGVSKPDKEIFEIACNKLKVNPEECIMIGDKFKVDIEGATKMGIKAIWINRKNENIKYPYTINKLKELNKFI